jgi:outer membrane protein assembly factor BamB
MLWQKSYGSQYVDYGNSITKLQNGDFMLAGSSRITSDSAVAVAIRINADGTEIWNKRYLPTVRNVEFTGVKQLGTGEIIVCGSDQGDTLFNSCYGILKSVDVNNGNVNWERQYHLFEDDSTQHYFYSMDTCSDGGLVMGGMILDRRGINSIVGNSYWVVKTDCAGNEYAWDNAACPKFVGIEEQSQNESFNLYPNPTNGHVTIDYFIPENATSNQLTFYDASGKKVQTFTLTGEGQVQQNLDCSAFASGVYQGVVVSDGKELVRRKLVVME